MLALASSFYMLALALGQAVIALKGHALVALGWGLGVVTFVVVTWLSSDELFRRIEFGLLFSSIAALLAFADRAPTAARVGRGARSGVDHRGDDPARVTRGPAISRLWRLRWRGRCRPSC